ncbi:DUF58 domain-containing protein [Ectobacillus ponti]|uniref:DUF58 domain-containing protein n=1 Tax=Ectobacillus ponti TaxID=2961894 RepID=A0AA41XAK3_9BACI|nr:DUF58 domain-containing protein [Ectobacillus ponti]MCP8969784.1 DUF58 domain-containing protein [Ectobacillus ponti]
MMRALRARLRHTGRRLLAPGFLLTTFIFAMFQGGFVSWFLFYSFLPFGLYAILLPLQGLRIASITRTTNQKEYGAGEPFTATITIERNSWLPLLYLAAEDVLPDSMRQETVKVLLFPWWKRRIEISYQLPSIPRGEHVLKTVKLRTGDFFGFVSLEKEYEVYDRFLVYPQYVDMVYRQFETRFEQGTTASTIHIERDTAVTAGVREYKPGDRFSWIDWKSSARRSRLMTKEFEQQQSHDVVLFMDRAASPQFEQLVTFAASLARAVLRKGSQLAFVSSGRERTVLPLRPGERQQQDILYHLAKVRDDSPFSFAQTSSAELRKLPRQVTCMIATSRLSPDIQQAAERLGSHGFVLVFVVKDKTGQLSGAEHAILEALKQRGIFVKAVHEGQYHRAFSEVGR